MATFASLKKSSADISRLTKEIEKLNGPSEGFKSADERYWKPTLDKSGNGFAVIRFLPEPEVDGDDGLPWVRLFTHGFKGPTGKWYIENSLTTLGNTVKDPAGEYNSLLWNSTDDKEAPARKQASNQKRRLHFISNILVVSDPKNPEAEGKVFLYKYGVKIFDKLSEAMNPPFDEMGRDPNHPQYDPTNRFVPFHLWEGANLKLSIKSIRQPDGKMFPNYDSSTWAPVSPIAGSDADIEKIYKSAYSLKEEIAPKNFKTYDELKRRLVEVIGDITSIPGQSSATKTIEEAPFKAAAQRKSVVAEDSDDDMEYFKNMADE